MDSYVCPTCNMTFRSGLFLVNHKEKFCIGKGQSQSERIRDQRTRCQQQVAKALREQQNYRSFQSGLQKPATETRPSNIENFHDMSNIHKFQLVLPNERKQHNEENTEIDLQPHGLAAENGNVVQLERMMLELKTQEQKNTSLLETLTEHIQQKLDNSNKRQDILQSNNSQFHSPRSRKRLTETCIPVYRNLSSEISSLHLSYLQNGGKDPGILAELQDLLNESLSLERQPEKHHQPKIHHRPRNKRNDFSKELISTETQNQQLEEELIQLQSRKIFCRPQLNGRLGEHEIKDMKLNIDQSKREIVINRLRRQIRGRKLEPSLLSFPPLGEPISQTPLFINRHTNTSDGLGSVPYDPEAGFVVFYDFLLDLCPLFRVCRLMVGVYNGNQVLGVPALLNPVYCESFSFSTVSSKYSQGHKAVLASKQAVPGVYPDESFSLVMQLQASGRNDINGQEATHLAPQGWVKLDLFDHNNCLRSGRWKIPVRILPVKPSMTSAEINTVPQLDNAELYLRIANPRDAETQSSVPISIHNACIYRYPTVTNPRQPYSREEFRGTVRPPPVLCAQINVPPFSQSIKEPHTAGDTLPDHLN